MAKRVVLGQKLDTAASAGLWDALLKAKGDDIVLDGSHVDMLGAQCLELLLGAVALWRRDGHSVSLEDPSPQMIENLGRFGLTPDLMVEDAA